MFAARYGHLEVVKLLLEHNAEVEWKDRRGEYLYSSSLLSKIVYAGLT